MLDPDGNAILVAQSKIGTATTEVTDLLGNSKPVNIAFSNELTRAQDSIRDQSANDEQTIFTSAELNNLVGNKVMLSAAEGGKGLNLGSQPTSGGLTAPLQTISVTPDGIDDPHTTGLASRSAPEAKSAINMSATLEVEVGEAKLSQASKISIDSDLSLRDDIESSRNVDDSNSLTGFKTASITTAAEQVPQGENPLASFAELKLTRNENKALNTALSTVPNDALKTAANEVTNTVPNSVPGSNSPVDLSADVKKELKLAAQVLLNNEPEIVDAGGKPVTLSAELDKVAQITERQATTKTTAFTETNEVAKAGAQADDIKADGKQASDTALLYKPSPGLITSGLGRTSVELNNGVSFNTPAIEPEVSLRPVLLNPLLSSSVGSSSITEPVSDEIAKAPVADQIRSFVNVQTVVNDERLSHVTRTSGPITNSDESVQSVSFQAANSPASPAGPTNTPPPMTLTELAMPRGGANTVDATDVTSGNADASVKVMGATNSGGTDLGSGESKNSHQQLAQSVVTTVDEDLALTQLRESVTAEHQNKFTNVAPGISLRQVVKPDQSANLTSLQPLAGPAELTSSNVYHATSNGIITAHSTPQNTGLVTDLASAPRTVLLDQPGADESLVDNLRWVVNEKLSRATINVSPANLGPITVSVDVENQNMNVSIIANSAVAKDAIDSLLPRMREHFGNEGYQQVSVDVSSQQERQANLRNQSGFSLEQESGSGADTRDADVHDSELAREEKRSTLDDRKTSQYLIDTYV